MSVRIQLSLLALLAFLGVAIQASPVTSADTSATEITSFLSVPIGDIDTFTPANTSLEEINSRSVPSTEIDSYTPSGISARSVDAKSLICGAQLTRWPWTSWTGAKAQADILNNIGKNCPAAAKTCSRTTCKNDNAIWLCNDSNKAISLPCGHVGEYAYAILNGPCWKSYVPFMKGSKYWLVRGQIFDRTGGWNVIVRKEAC